MAKITYNIENVAEDGIATKIYWMKPANGEQMKFKPGQFVKIFFPGNEKEFRMFSIASPPEKDALEFCIKILPDGKFSQTIDKIALGEKLTIEGPFGHFVYDGSNNCVFVAAGTGIAPVISMLRHIVNNKIPGNFTLFFSNKTEKSILYYDELRSMAKQHPGIHVIFTLTQEAPDSWQGERGRINGEMVSKYVKDASEKAWFFCGPIEFVKTIKDYTLGQGAHPQRIKMEGWG